jgi:hypothetical protein
VPRPSSVNESRHCTGALCSVVQRGLKLIVLCLWLASTGSAQSRSYTYDDTGNRLSATAQPRFTSPAVFGFEPPSAAPGERVNIYGRSFDSRQRAGYAVVLGGQPMPVLSVAQRVITVEVPSGAASGTIVVRVPGGAELPLGRLAVDGVSILPPLVDAELGESVQFQAVVSGAKTAGVLWAVGGLPGGSATLGTVSPSGLYTLPVPGSRAAFPFVISATSVETGRRGYTLVRARCGASAAIAIGERVPGVLDGGTRRLCYDFAGERGWWVRAAYSGPLLAGLRLREPLGEALAEAGPGSGLTLDAVCLPETGPYRLELEALAVEGAFTLVVERLLSTTVRGVVVFADGSAVPRAAVAAGTGSTLADLAGFFSFPAFFPFQVGIEPVLEVAASAVVEGEAHGGWTRVVAVPGGISDAGAIIIDRDGDQDGLPDAYERDAGTSPSSADSDGDALLDGAEVRRHGTDPLRFDTDGDLYPDGAEVEVGSDPLDAGSQPRLHVAAFGLASALVLALPEAGPGGQPFNVTVASPPAVVLVLAVPEGGADQPFNLTVASPPAVVLVLAVPEGGPDQPFNLTVASPPAVVCAAAEAEVCANGVDDDCDGLADAADPDCAP